MNVEIEIESVLHDIFCNVLTFSDKKDTIATAEKGIQNVLRVDKNLIK